MNTKQGVKSLIQDVRDKGYTVSASHGGMSQLGRDTAIQEFRAGSSRILIATDLRGTNLGQVHTTDAVYQPCSAAKEIF